MKGERRKHIRIQKDEPVFYSDPFITYDPRIHVTAFVGLTLDIGNGGVCIMTKHRFSEGDNVKVSFSSVGSATAIATVKWCERLDMDSYRVGLHIPYPDIS